jgi:hypothetical protein
MVSLPWYLLAVGIGLVLIGLVWANLPGSSDRRGRGIHARMRDDEIVRNLKRAERIPLPNLVILAGIACVLVSVVWRLVWRFV